MAQVSVEQMEQERQERAASELYTFVKSVEDGTTVVYCLSHKSKETYTITRHACTCKDWEFRGSKLGIECKHRLGLLDAHREGRVHS